MRRVAILGTSLAVTALALAACQKKDEAAATGDATQASAAASAPLAGPPKRKPGLWSHTIQSDGVNQPMKVCLDADTDAKMSVVGQQVGKDMCSKQSFTPTAGGWSFASECDTGAGGKVVSSGVATGDFNSSYVVKATSTTTGSAMAKADGTHEMTLTAKWEGPCPAGMKGGDMAMTLPDGRTMTFNAEQMTGMMGGGQK